MEKGVRDLESWTTALGKAPNLSYNPPSAKCAKSKALQGPLLGSE